MTNVTLFDTVIQPMTEGEANDCLRRIKRHLNDARNEILALYEREGWLVLGYTSWVECVQSEFADYSQARIYQLKEAAEIERNLINSTVVENAIPERQLRPIAQSNLQPEQQREVWKKANETAPNGKVTAAHVERVVKEYKSENPALPPAPVRQFAVPEFITVTQWHQMSASNKERSLNMGNSKSSFNQTNDNVEWASWTWNPVTGCLHNCAYCYARDIANRFYTHLPDNDRFSPVFYPERLTGARNTKQPDLSQIDDPVRQMGLGNVFVCSMADLFGKWVPTEWIEAVLQQAWDNPQWNFLFLTKFPIRMAEFKYPPNTWIGTTVDTQYAVERAEKAFRKVRASGYEGVAWLSCEPMMERITFSSLDMFDWVVVGGASKSTQTPEFRPPFEWIVHLWTQAKALDLPVYMKTNLWLDDAHKGIEVPNRVREYPGLVLINKE